MRRTRSKGQQYGGERPLLNKEWIPPLQTPSVALPYLLDPLTVFRDRIAIYLHIYFDQVEKTNASFFLVKHEIKIRQRKFENHLQLPRRTVKIL